MDAVHFQLLFVCLCVFQSLHSFHNNNNHFHSTNLAAPPVNDDWSCRQDPVGLPSWRPTPNTSLPPTSPSNATTNIRSPIEQSEIHTHSHSFSSFFVRCVNVQFDSLPSFHTNKQTTQSNVNNKPLEAVQCVVASPLALLQHDPIQAGHHRCRPTKGMSLCLSARSCDSRRTACR